MKIKNALLITILAFLALVIFYVYAFSQENYAKFVPSTDILFIFISLAASIITFFTFKILGWKSREGKVWFFFSLGLFMTFIGDFLWMFYEVILKTDPFPSAADIFYIGHNVFFVTAFLIELKTMKETIGKKGVIISSLLTLAAASVIFYFTIIPISYAADYDIVSKIVSLSYPIAGLVILFPALLSIFAFRGAKPWFVITISILAMLAADAYFSYLDWNELYSGINMIIADLLWLAGYLSFAFGAYYYKIIAQGKG